MEARRASQPDGSMDSLIVLQHSPVYTLGRRGDVHNFLFSQKSDMDLLRRRGSRAAAAAPGAAANDDGSNNPVAMGIGKAGGSDFHHIYHSLLQENPDYRESEDPSLLYHPTNFALLFRVDRGGDVTFHGPGQITCYPILDLQGEAYKKDLHWYLEKIEDVVIGVLEEFGLKGERDKRGTGVWVRDRKIAQVGIGCSGWVTKHGFAINVKKECMPYFEEIIPCGIERTEGSVVCLEDVLGEEVHMEVVDEAIRRSFEKEFGINVNLHEKEDE